MLTPKGRWYVITGAPGTGKSTLISQLSKMGYEVFEEIGRKLIDEDIKQGKTLADIMVDSPEFESRFVETQYQLEMHVDPNKLVFFDRGILDTLPYHQYYNWSVAPNVKRICNEAKYAKTVFLLDMLDDYDQTFNRVETKEVSEGLQKLAGTIYEKRGYDVIKIPPISIEKRIEMLLKNVKEA